MTPLRFIHMADLHLDNKLSYSTYDKDGMSSTLAMMKENLHSVRRVAIEKECKFIIVAGDIFNRYRPDEKARVVWADFIKQCIENGIKIIGITGQHDIGVENPHMAFNTLTGSDVRILDEATTIWSSDERIVFTCVPYRAFMGRIIPPIGKDNAKYHIFIGHFPVSGSKLDGKNPFFSDDWMPLSAYNKLLEEYDYVALGDIHHRQLSYPGSLINMDFGDPDSEKGFYYVEETDKGLEKAFIPHINQRKFLIFNESVFAVRNETLTISLKDMIVRVESTDPTLLNEMEKYCQDEGASFVVSKLLPKFEIRKERIKGLDGKKLDIKIAITDYVERNVSSNDQKERLIEVGLSYVGEK